MRLPAGARLLLALLAGLAVPLTLAPFDLWWLGPLAVAALAVALQAIDAGPSSRGVASLSTSRGVAAGFSVGFVFGLGKYGLGVSWIYVSIHVYGHAPPWLAGFLVAVFVGGLSLFEGAAGAAYRAWFHRTQRGGALRNALALWGLWLARDWVFTWAFTGFPWLLLGYGHVESPLAGYAPLLGVHGVTAVVALCGVLLPPWLARLHAMRAGGRPGVLAWAAPACVLALWAGGEAARGVTFVQPLASRSVALVQGNIDQDTKWNAEFAGRTLSTYVRLSAPHMDVDILLWPEAAVTVLLEEAGPFLSEMGRRTARHGGALVTGIVSWRREQGIRNLTVVAGAGEGVYVKRRLVPFGEYVPLEGLLRGLIGFFDLPMSHTEPGAERQPLLRVGDARIAMAICYEVVYPALVRRQAEGANLLATISNDTWFGASIGPLQHLQMARMRALELGRWMLRATNNGVTAVIDARGRVVARLPQFVEGALRARVELMTGATPYQRFGDVPVLLLGALALALGLRTRAG